MARWHDGFSGRPWVHACGRLLDRPCEHGSGEGSTAPSLSRGGQPCARGCLPDVERTGGEGPHGRRLRSLRGRRAAEGRKLRAGGGPGRRAARCPARAQHRARGAGDGRGGARADFRHLPRHVFYRHGGIASHPAIAGQSDRPRRRRRRLVCGDDAGHVSARPGARTALDHDGGVPVEVLVLGPALAVVPGGSGGAAIHRVLPGTQPGPDLRHARQQHRPGFGTRELLRGHRHRDDSTAAREACPRRVGRPVKAPGRVARRAQGRHRDLQWLAAVHTQPEPRAPVTV